MCETGSVEQFTCTCFVFPSQVKLNNFLNNVCKQLMHLRTVWCPRAKGSIHTTNDSLTYSCRWWHNKFSQSHNSITFLCFCEGLWTESPMLPFLSLFARRVAFTWICYFICLWFVFLALIIPVLCPLLYGVLDYSPWCVYNVHTVRKFGIWGV